MWPSAKKTGDYHPVFYKDFARSAQSAETLWNTLGQTDWKRRFAVYEHDQSAVLFFTICGWRQEDIFLEIISIFCAHGRTVIVIISSVFLSLSFKTNACVRQDLYDSMQYCFFHTHRRCYNQHTMKVPGRRFKSTFPKLSVYIVNQSWEKSEHMCDLTFRDLHSPAGSKQDPQWTDTA